MADEPESTSSYLAEVFAPGCTSEQLEERSRSMSIAARRRSALGEPVRHVRSYLVPGEETAFFFFEAERESAVEHTLRDVGVDAERICVVVAGQDDDPNGTAQSGSSRTRRSCVGQLEGALEAGSSRGDEGDA